MCSTMDSSSSSAPVTKPLAENLPCSTYLYRVIIGALLYTGYATKDTHTHRNAPSCFFLDTPHPPRVSLTTTPLHACLPVLQWLSSTPQARCLSPCSMPHHRFRYGWREIPGALGPEPCSRSADRLNPGAIVSTRQSLIDIAEHGRLPCVGCFFLSSFPHPPLTQPTNHSLQGAACPVIHTTRTCAQCTPARVLLLIIIIITTLLPHPGRATACVVDTRLATKTGAIRFRDAACLC